MSTDLLARFAQNAFWLARYVERAENLARILDINETYARERHGEPDWQRILDLYADTERFDRRHRTASAEHVLNFYLIDGDNPTSVVAALDQAREDARAIRHLISTEMWTHLNIFRNRVAAIRPGDIRSRQVSRLCQEIRQDCQTFEGIAEGTFFRGQAWCFYSIGKYVERADQTTRILDMGYERLVGADGADGAENIVQWNVLLRSVAGYHAFRSLHPSGVEPEAVAAFLLYDRGFPRAVGLCVDRVRALLGLLEDRDRRPDDDPAEAELSRLEFTLNTGLGRSITVERLRAFVDRLQAGLISLSNRIAETYFGAARLP